MNLQTFTDVKIVFLGPVDKAKPMPDNFTFHLLNVQPIIPNLKILIYINAH